MEIFKQVTSSVKPLPVDNSSEHYVYINENVMEYQMYGGTLYKYDQKRYTKEEYMEYIYDALNNKIEGVIDVDSLDLKGSIEYAVNRAGKACTESIYEGVDVTLFNQITEHFSLTATDQQNLQSLFSSILNFGLTSVAYHADGKSCRMYDYYDFIKIYLTANFKILKETTYCNYLNNYIRSLNDKDKVLECYYGMELPKEDQEAIDKVVTAQITELVLAIKSKYPDIVIPLNL